MSRLPIEMIQFLEELPQKEKKREHLFGLINWRLSRGRCFTAKEIYEASRYRVSLRYTQMVIDSVILLDLAMELPGGRFGPSKRNVKACSAMVRNTVREKREASRKDLRYAIATPIDDNMLDRILRELVGTGELVKLSKGKYGLPECSL